MRYYKARQKENNSGWHYTCKRDDFIYPVGWCAHHEPHPTAEEAYECYKQYLLKTEVVRTNGHDIEECDVCKEPTQRVIRIGSGMGHYFHLCSKHDTQEILYDLFSVGESWES